MDWILLILTLLVILAGAELFTNGVEWVGEGFGLSEGAVGSVLAAIGTALPETVLPLIAVLLGHQAGKEIGVGAILGAPLMLTTLAMFVLGLTVLLFSRTGRRDREIHADASVLKQDLLFFLGMFALATVAGVWHFRPFKWALAAGLLVAYGYYVYLHFRKRGGLEVDKEGTGGIKPLYLSRVGRRIAARPTRKPSVSVSVAQTLIGLAVIVTGARVFVLVVSDLADQFRVSKLAFALLVAPVATELPETFNAGVIWARRGRDTLATGNITGAMVFQSAFPVSIGLLLTPWRFEADSFVAALVALGAGMVLLLTLTLRGRYNAWMLLLQGLFFAGYVAFVVSTL